MKIQKLTGKCPAGFSPLVTYSPLSHSGQLEHLLLNHSYSLDVLYALSVLNENRTNIVQLAVKGCVFGFNNFAQCYDLDPLNTSYTLSCQIRRSELCVAYKSASPFTPIHTYIHFDLSHPHILKSVSTKYALSGTLPWIRTPAKNVLVPMWCEIMF